MKLKLFSLTILPLALLLSSCGHTNKLANYDVRSKEYNFTSIVAANAQSTNVHIADPSGGGLAGAVSAIGGAVIEVQLSEKLDRAARPDDFAREVSKGLQTALTTYLDARATNTMEPSVSYIVETTLTNCSINSGSGGSSIHIAANSRIIDRATGNVVWENGEDRTVSLSRTYGAPGDPNVVRTAASLFNAADLMGMSDAELGKVLKGAALSIGHDMAETLREDVSEMHK